MDKKDVMYLRLKCLEKDLAQKRRKWFLWMWLGYSAISFWLMKEFRNISNILDFLFDDPMEFFGLLIASAVLGLFSWFVNAAVWTTFCNSIQSTVRAYEKLEKEYNNTLRG